MTSARVCSSCSPYLDPSRGKTSSVFAYLVLSPSRPQKYPIIELKAKARTWLHSTFSCPTTGHKRGHTPGCFIVHVTLWCVEEVVVLLDLVVVEVVVVVVVVGGS